MSNKKQFLLRVDSKLFEAVEHWADDELRSVNSHIEYLLKEAIRKSGRMKRNQNQSSDDIKPD